jgi:hypothetical protein
MRPAYSQCLVRKRTELARQTRHGAGDEPDLCPSPVSAVITVGDAKLEGDVVEAAELPEVAAKLGDLLLALLGFDFAGLQRRQLGNRSAGGAQQERM